MAYAYKRRITVDYTKCGSGNSTDFPLCFAGTYTWLKTSANGGDLANASGYDLNFYSDEALTTPLKYEREMHVLTTGQVVLWVKIPTLSASADTVIYIGYGDAGVTTDQSDKVNVWKTGFRGVYHLGETRSTAAGNYKDSTSNANNGTLTDTDADCVSAAVKIGNGMDFAGDLTDRITVTDAASLDITGDFAITGWAQTNTTPAAGNYYGVLGKGTGAIPSNYIVVFDNGYLSSGLGLVAAVYNAAGSAVTAKITVSASTLYFFCMKWVAATGVVSISINNGTPVTSSASGYTANANTANLALGHWSDADSSYALDGLVDEIRIHSGALDANWITAQYNNENSPSTFYSVVLVSDTPTAITASDTLTVSVSESQVSLGALAASDTLAVSVAESQVSEGALARTDTLSVSISESQESIGTLAASDTIAVSISEGVALGVVLAASDTVAVGLTEAVSLQGSLVASDSLVVALGESQESLGTLAVADAVSVSLTEAQASSGELASSDSLTLSVNEAQAVQAALSAADSITLNVTEAQGSFSELSPTDTLATSIAEGQESLCAVSPSDSVGVSVGDVAALEAALAASDTIALAIVEAAGILVAITASDTLAVACAEAVAIYCELASTDALAVSFAESQVSFGTLDVNDQASVLLAEAQASFISTATSDALLLASSESAGLLVAYSVSDTLSVGFTASALLVGPDTATVSSPPIITRADRVMQKREWLLRLSQKRPRSPVWRVGGRY